MALTAGPPIGSNTFKNTVAIMQGVGQDMNFGVLIIDELAIHPNLI